MPDEISSSDSRAEQLRTPVSRKYRVTESASERRFEDL
jgi:hypothetical protein